jgi:hypothetical protein
MTSYDIKNGIVRVNMFSANMAQAAFEYANSFNEIVSLNERELQFFTTIVSS